MKFFIWMIVVFGIVCDSFDFFPKRMSVMTNCNAQESVALIESKIPQPQFLKELDKYVGKRVLLTGTCDENGIVFSEENIHVFVLWDKETEEKIKESLLENYFLSVEIEGKLKRLPIVQTDMESDTFQLSSWQIKKLSQKSFENEIIFSRQETSSDSQIKETVSLTGSLLLGEKNYLIVGEELFLIENNIPQNMRHVIRRIRSVYQKNVILTVECYHTNPHVISLLKLKKIQLMQNLENEERVQIKDRLQLENAIGKDVFIFGKIRIHGDTKSPFVCIELPESPLVQKDIINEYRIDEGSMKQFVDRFNIPKKDYYMSETPIWIQGKVSFSYHRDDIVIIEASPRPIE